MSEIDRDLQSRLKKFADEVEPDASREGMVLERSRGKRRLVALTSALMALLLVGGVGGASMLAGGRDGIEPAPRPTRAADLRQKDLVSMSVTEIAAALFVDDDIRDAVPPSFTLTDVVRNGPAETNHEYATVGVRMTGPVDFARVIFFVHPDDAAASEMYDKELYNSRWSFQAARQSEDFRGWRPYAVANAAPGTKCSAGVDSLFTCMALRGRVLMLTQSTAGGLRLGGKVSETQLEAAETLARAFSSYLIRVYPAPPNVTDATNVIEAQGGTVRLEVDPIFPTADTIPQAVLVNDTKGKIAYRQGAVLERRTQREWQPLRRSPHLCGLSAEFLHLRPGQDAIHPIGGYDADCDVVPLGTGEYRLTQIVQLNPLEKASLSIIFTIREASLDLHVDRKQGVKVEVPEGWSVAARSLTPHLGDPREILSLGTAPMSPGGSCAQQPVRALDALSPTDAFISIQERRGEAGHPARPSSFRETLEDRFLNIDLCTNMKDFKPYWFAFSDANRDFHLLAALGTDASGKRTRQFWAVLDSLEFFESDETATVRSTVREFMRARVDGAGAEGFLGSEGWREPGPTGEPAPLYPDPPLEDFRIEFVDDLGDGTYEVGVSLIFESGTSGETLFVRRSDGGFVIVGARGGLEGP